MSETISPEVMEPPHENLGSPPDQPHVGPFPDTIHERMNAILRALPAIGKGNKNAQQGFMFRGHDDVMNELNPLLSKYQVFFVPSVVERVTGERRTSKGTVLYEVNLHVLYRFYGPRGDYVEASAWGEGTDAGDKATNKAMTMALKNVLAQSFAVSTEENSKYDTDASSDEETVGRRDVDARQPELPIPQTWAQVEELVRYHGDAVWLEFQALMRAAKEFDKRFSNSSVFRQAAAGVAVALREEFEPSELPGPGIADLQRLWSAAVAGEVLTPLYPEAKETPTEAAGEPEKPAGESTAAPTEEVETDDEIPS